MAQALTPDDHVAIAGLFARYCYLIDRNRAAEWTALFTPDGSFEIVGIMTVAGAEQLGGMPAVFAQQGGGKWRHQIMNIFADPDDAADTALAFASGLVSDWTSGFRAVSLGDYEATLRKQDGAWRFVALKATMMQG